MTTTAGRRRSRLLACACAVVTASTLGASGAGAATATYYVDVASRGGACSDARTPEQNTYRTPWCSLARAIRAAPAGSRVLLRAGTYPRTDVTTANKGGYVSFGPYAREVPVLGAMFLTDVSHLRFYNLKTNANVTVRDGQNLEFIGGESALKPAGTRTLTAFNFGAVSDVLVAERHIHDGFTAVLLDSSTPNNTRVTVRDNRIVRMGNDAVHIGGDARDIRVLDNDIVNVRPRSDMLASAHSDAVQVIGPSWNVTIAGNRVTGGRGFLFMVSPQNQGLTGHGHRNAQVVNNLLLGYAFGMRAWSFVNGRIINNTFWGTSNTESLSLFDRVGTTNDRTTGIVLANNVVKVLRVGAGVGFALRDYNIVRTGPLGGARDVRATPSFVDPSALDFGLRPGSVGVDSATSALAPVTDQMGLSRYGAPDRGALERQP